MLIHSQIIVSQDFSSVCAARQAQLGSSSTKCAPQAPLSATSPFGVLEQGWFKAGRVAFLSIGRESQGIIPFSSHLCTNRVCVSCLTSCNKVKPQGSPGEVAIHLLYVKIFKYRGGINLIRCLMEKNYDTNNTSVSVISQVFSLYIYICIYV